MKQLLIPFGTLIIGAGITASCAVPLSIVNAEYTQKKEDIYNSKHQLYDNLPTDEIRLEIRNDARDSAIHTEQDKLHDDYVGKEDGLLFGAIILGGLSLFALGFSFIIMDEFF